MREPAGHTRELCNLTCERSRSERADGRSETCDQMRSASGALVGDGGGTGGLGGAAGGRTFKGNNATCAASAMPKTLASAHSTPGVAAIASGPVTQQLSPLAITRASDVGTGDAFAAVATGSVADSVP